MPRKQRFKPSRKPAQPEAAPHTKEQPAQPKRVDSREEGPASRKDGERDVDVNFDSSENEP
jgi:hypothetical protein